MKVRTINEKSSVILIHKRTTDTTVVSIHDRGSSVINDRTFLRRFKAVSNSVKNKALPKRIKSS